jgi:hypothetical protein
VFLAGVGFSVTEVLIGLGVAVVKFDGVVVVVLRLWWCCGGEIGKSRFALIGELSGAGQ